MFCVVLCCIATILAHFVSFVNALLNKNVPFAENILFTQKYSPHFYKNIFRISSAAYGANDVWMQKAVSSDKAADRLGSVRFPALIDTELQLKSLKKILIA